ncbi:cysteine desulfurase-like protein [Rubrobacter marinus]|uniref:Cysteine desulfurase-like protein n=1 Tax=Rubrobacter marinus TaxID=2653852 RepID=A0A6G8PTP9_9ACTN|nr:cysteine desulfurase-like protein [Rubrobacter marinus]QIN77311.1 cysteine desulfurase-like protein [Rubrobacter marinus]
MVLGRRTFDVEAVREEFPALGRRYNGRRVAYLDGPGGSQVVRGAIEAVAGYMTRGGANLHGAFVTSRETEEIIAGARAASAAFLGAEPDEVAFGHNMTTLTLAISRALSKGWDGNTEVVVTEIDHRANVDPWTLAAADRGTSVRWIPVDAETLTLDLTNLDELVNERTKLVAVNLASNAVGTVNDVARISERAREVGAVVAVDAVHAAAHIPIDRDALGADVLTCSAYKFFGPHVGVTAIRRDLFETLAPYKLAPGPSHAPDKLETGTQNHEGLAGVEAAISFVSSLGGGTTLREGIVSGMEAVEAYEAELAASARARLREMPGVTLYASPDGVRKTPTIALRLEGRSPLEVCEHMSERGIFVAGGDFYATTLAGKLGLDGSGGFVRAGLAPYNTAEEVDAFLDALEELAVP